MAIFATPNKVTPTHKEGSGKYDPVMRAAICPESIQKDIKIETNPVTVQRVSRWHVTDRGTHRNISGRKTHCQESQRQLQRNGSPSDTTYTVSEDAHLRHVRNPAEVYDLGHQPIRYSR